MPKKRYNPETSSDENSVKKAAVTSKPLDENKESQQRHKLSFEERLHQQKVEDINKELEGIYEEYKSIILAERTTIDIERCLQLISQATVLIIERNKDQSLSGCNVEEFLAKVISKINEVPSTKMLDQMQTFSHFQMFMNDNFTKAKSH